MLEMQDAAAVILGWSREPRARMVVTPNTDHFVRWASSPSFRRLYDRADLRTVDGAPLVWLAALSGSVPPPHVTGVDLFLAVAERAAAEGVPLAIIGGGPGVAEAAAERLVERHPGIMVSFTAAPSPAELGSEGYLRGLLAALSEEPAKIVALCVGSPKQEELFVRLEGLAGGTLSGVFLCVGATVDFVAGRVRRSPPVLRRLGLEWIFRLAMEPGRLWRRYLVEDVQIVRYFGRAVLGGPETWREAGMTQDSDGQAGRSTTPPGRVDRLVIHQFDPARPSPGGIDTCLRGICRYVPRGVRMAVVGVDTGSGPSERALGRWEEYRSASGDPFWFLPVARLDPAQQRRILPHSLRLMWGVLRFRRHLPLPAIVQAHRMDTALLSRFLIRRPQAYMIHTQENGLTGTTSDSMWRFAGGVHRFLEQLVVRRARSVTVFNEQYASVVRRWNPRARFSPTWYDPALLRRDGAERDPFRILWVGRLERPKDPMLAVAAFERLTESDPASPWTLELLGGGTLLDELRQHVKGLPEPLRTRVLVRGRVEPDGVAERMAAAGVFLMTSHPGYEGYPRVLVEALASGLPAAVTDGSDTGGLIEAGRTGLVCSRDPGELAAAIASVSTLDRAVAMERVAPLDAPHLVAEIFRQASMPRKKERA